MSVVALSQEFKVCYKCKKTLPKSMFSKNKESKDGLQHKCKPCDNEYQRSRPRDQEYEKQYRLKKSKDFDYRIQGLLNASKQRAKEKNREHDLTKQDLIDLFPKDGCCPIFGFKLEWNGGGFRETSPSVDRIDSTKGYTKDNVQIISWKANRIKGYASIEDLEILLSYLKQGD
jgi:hypothetical protein